MLKGNYLHIQTLREEDWHNNNDAYATSATSSATPMAAAIQNTVLRNNFWQNLTKMVKSQLAISLKCVFSAQCDLRKRTFCEWYVNRSVSLPSPFPSCLRCERTLSGKSKFDTRSIAIFMRFLRPIKTHLETHHSRCKNAAKECTFWVKQEIVNLVLVWCVEALWKINFSEIE